MCCEYIVSRFHYKWSMALNLILIRFALDAHIRADKTNFNGELRLIFF